jgi:hypothetical protein
VFEKQQQHWRGNSNTTTEKESQQPQHWPGNRIILRTARVTTTAALARQQQ